MFLPILQVDMLRLGIKLSGKEQMPTLPETFTKLTFKPQYFHPRVLISRLDHPRTQLQQAAQQKVTQFKYHVTTTFRSPVFGLEMRTVL